MTQPWPVWAAPGYLGHMHWGIVCAEDEDAWSLLEAVQAEHRELRQLHD